MNNGYVISATNHIELDDYSKYYTNKCEAK